MNQKLSMKKGGDPSETLAWNMRLISHHELAGFGGVGEGINMQVTKNGRRILWLAHWGAPKNFTGVDVTDPRNPAVAKFIPGPANTNTVQVDLADNIMVAALGRPENRAGTGMDPNKPYEAGVILIDSLSHALFLPPQSMPVISRPPNGPTLSRNATSLSSTVLGEP